MPCTPPGPPRPASAASQLVKMLAGMLEASPATMACTAVLAASLAVAQICFILRA